MLRRKTQDLREIVIQGNEHASFGGANAEHFFIIRAAHALLENRRHVVTIGFQRGAPSVADILV